MLKRPKKITFINQTLGIGGAETFHANLFNSLQEKDVRISVYTTNKRFVKQLKVDKSEIIPIVVDLIGDWKGFLKGVLVFPFAFLYYGFIVYRSRDTDLILLAGFIEKFMVSPWARLLRIKVVWIDYGPLSKILSKFMNVPKFLYLVVKDIPEFVITSSKYSKKDLVDNLGIPNNKILVIQLGIKARTLKQKVIPGRVVSVSRLERGKGQDILIKSWSQVVKQFPLATLTIVGEGSEFENLKKLIISLKLESSVKLTGWVDDSLAEMAKGEIFVFPTLWELEGFGMVAIEAMSQGKPVIGFNFGPVPEIVDSECGMLLEKKDEYALAKAINKLLGNKELVEKLGRNSKKNFIKNYTIETVAGNFLKVFEIIQNEKKEK